MVKFRTLEGLTGPGLKIMYGTYFIIKQEPESGCAINFC